jgi:hypothetical protein
MIKQVLAAATLAAAATLPAHAVTFEGALTQGGTTVTDYSGVGLLSFDIDFANASPVQMEFRVDSSDLLQPIAFNAILRNFTGSGIDGYTLALDRGGFGVVGTVIRQFGGSTDIGVAGATATFSFNTPEFLDVEVGNALGTTPGAADWTLVGLQAGDRINLTVSVVPEPGTVALWLAGLAGVGFVVRRRRG